MTRQAIYLDHNAAAPLLPEARDAIVAVLDLAGNPSSVHAHGRALRERIEAARGAVARLAGAERGQVVFTSSGSEAITQAIVGGVKAFALDGVVVSAGEHAAVLKAAEASGVPVETIGIDADGLVDLEALRLTLDAADADGRTLLVALQWANNETGVVQPVARIGALVGPTRHLLFVDAVQVFGKRDLDFAASAPDMMAVSAHKIGGAAGAGALLAKPHADAVRLIPGGGQEQGRRGGTEAAAAIAGFGAAATAVPQRYEAGRIAALSEQAEVGLRDLAPDAVVFGAGAERIGNTVNFAVPGLANAVAMMGLDLDGVSVSSGSACSSGKVGASHVLSAMGVDPALAGCALRISLGWSSTAADVAGFLAAFGALLERRRNRAA